MIKFILSIAGMRAVHMYMSTCVRSNNGKFALILLKISSPADTCIHLDKHIRFKSRNQRSWEKLFSSTHKYKTETGLPFRATKSMSTSTCYMFVFRKSLQPRRTLGLSCYYFTMWSASCIWEYGVIRSLQNKEIYVPQTLANIFSS